MDAEKLVSMANQIAAYFRAYPEDEAAAGVRDHINAFWAPGMRRTLSARIAASPAGVQPLVVTALAEGTQGAPLSPANKAVAGAGTLGQLGSDAG